MFVMTNGLPRYLVTSKLLQDVSDKHHDSKTVSAKQCYTKTHACGGQAKVQQYKTRVSSSPVTGASREVAALASSAGEVLDSRLAPAKYQ